MDAGPKPKPVTVDELVKRVLPLLRTVTVDSEGNGFRMSFEDDDLLWGHEIVVEFDSDDGPVDVRLVG